MALAYPVGRSLGRKPEDLHFYSRNPFIFSDHHEKLELELSFNIFLTLNNP